MASFSTKFIAFIDILGFKKLVKQAESGAHLTLDQIIDFTNVLGTAEEVAAVSRFGPTVLPYSNKQTANVDFQLTQISDCVVVSTEISDSGVIQLLDYCSIVVLRLLRAGLMCRGYVTKGSIYHTPTQFIGSGYERACDAEREVRVFKGDDEKGGPPFIELSPEISAFIEQSTDATVKTMFQHFVLSDNKELTALYPFRRHLASLDTTVSHEGLSDVQRQERVNLVRDSIIRLRNGLEQYSPESDPEAFEKLRHYRRALDEQLAQCDIADQAIDDLATPFPCHTIGSIFRR